MLLHNPQCDRQAKAQVWMPVANVPGPCSGLSRQDLFPNKWLQHRRSAIFRDTWSIVLDDHACAAGAPITRADLDNTHS